MPAHLPASTNVITVHSIHQFRMQDWHSLAQNGCGTIITSDNSRRYHVLWNQSGILTVKRDLSNVDFFTRFKETLQRGIFVSTLADQLATRLNQLSDQVEQEKPIRVEIEKNIQTIDSLKFNLRSIQEIFNFIDAYPNFSATPDSHTIKEQCIQHCQDIAVQHQMTIGKLKADVTKQLDALHSQLNTLQQNPELPADFDQQVAQMKQAIDALGFQIIKIDHINTEHQLTLKLFVTAINLTKTPMVAQYLLARTTMLSNAFSEFAKAEHTAEEQQTHVNFLKDQNRVATTLILRRGESNPGMAPLKSDSALEECGKLFLPPKHPDTKLQEQLNDVYRAKASVLADTLSNHESTWNQIDAEMTALETVKADLKKQIKTGKKIAAFLDKANKSGRTAVQQKRLDALGVLKTRCDAPGLDVASDSLLIAAENQMKAIQIQNDITHFLDKSLIGKRGVSMFNDHFYDFTRQARINSLIALEQDTLSNDVEIDDLELDQINWGAIDHMNAIKEWAARNLHYTNTLIAGFDCIPVGLTYDNFRARSRDASFNQRRREAQQELSDLMVIQHENLLVMQERGELLKKTDKKTQALRTHAQQFKDAAVELNNPFHVFLNMI